MAKGPDMPDDQVPETLLVAPPADIDARIAAMDERVGEALPEDYKEFLRTTNGFKPAWTGLYTGPPLHGADDVKWVDMTASSYLSRPMLLVAEPSGLPGVNWESERWPCWRKHRVLALGPFPDDPHSTLLVPPGETRRVFAAYREALSPDTDLLAKDSQPEAIRKALESRFGNWEERFLEQDSWMVMRDDMMAGNSDLPAFASFKAFLAYMADESDAFLFEESRWFYSSCRAD